MEYQRVSKGLQIGFKFDHKFPGRRRINWISWEKVCLDKGKCGLGVKHYEHFNLSLLSKWKWRILNERKTIWYGLLVFKYRDIKLNLVNIFLC